MNISDKMPTLSGDFDSLELTENQQKLLDILKGVGKISLIASKSQAVFSVERPDGLQSFLRKVQARVDEGKPYGREELETLEKEVRYQEMQEELGNKTEFLRVLMGNLHSNKNFQNIVSKVVDEQMDLSYKRATNRSLAESQQATEFGN